MKSILSILVLMSIVTIISCSDNDTSKTVVGKWKLVQVLADPGDGSGEFVDVNSSQVLEFYNDNTFFSNTDLCTFRSDATVTTEGNYSFGNEELMLVSCAQPNKKLLFKIEDNFLTLYHFCIEACAEKYLKLE